LGENMKPSKLIKESEEYERFTEDTEYNDSLNMSTNNDANRQKYVLNAEEVESLQVEMRQQKEFIEQQSDKNSRGSETSMPLSVEKSMVCESERDKFERDQYLSIFDNLFISNKTLDDDEEFLNNFDIKAIVNTSESTTISNKRPVYQPKTSSLDELSDIIDEALTEGGSNIVVLDDSVECDRAIKGCLAYLIKVKGWRAKPALVMIQKKIPWWKVEPVFLISLQDWRWELKQRNLKKHFSAVVNYLKQQYHPSYLPYIISLLMVFMAVRFLQEQVQEDHRREKERHLTEYEYFQIKKWP